MIENAFTIESRPNHRGIKTGKKTDIQKIVVTNIAGADHRHTKIGHDTNGIIVDMAHHREHVRIIVTVKKVAMGKEGLLRTMVFLRN